MPSKQGVGLFVQDAYFLLGTSNYNILGVYNNNQIMTMSQHHLKQGEANLDSPQQHNSTNFWSYFYIYEKTYLLNGDNLPYFSDSCTHHIPAPTHPFLVHLCVLRTYPK